MVDDRSREVKFFAQKNNKMYIYVCQHQTIRFQNIELIATALRLPATHFREYREHLVATEATYSRCTIL